MVTMTPLFLSTLLLSILLWPELAHGWPQRRTRQEPTPSTSPPMTVCNITFVADARSSRPSFPDPQDDDKDRTNRDEKIIFPGSEKNKVITIRDNFERQRFVPVVQERGPSCAEGTTFCEESDNYPSAYLRDILRFEFKIHNEFFGQDVKNGVKKQLRGLRVASETQSLTTAWALMITEPNITQRIDVSDETPLCPSLEQVVYPKMAQNKEDKWLFIINQDQFVQGVRVEKCIKEGPCSLTEGIPIGYTTKCRQKYIYRKMLSLNEDGKAISDAFRIPSCCACYYRPTASMLASRMGNNVGQTSSVSRGIRVDASVTKVDVQQSSVKTQAQSPARETSTFGSTAIKPPEANIPKPRASSAPTVTSAPRLPNRFGVFQ